MPILSSAKLSRGSLRPSDTAPRDTSADKRTIAFLVQSKSAPLASTKPEEMLRAELDALRAYVENWRQGAAPTATDVAEGRVVAGAGMIGDALVVGEATDFAWVQPPRTWDFMTSPQGDWGPPPRVPSGIKEGLLAEAKVGGKRFVRYGGRMVEAKMVVPGHSPSPAEPTLPTGLPADRVVRVKGRPQPPPKSR